MRTLAIDFGARRVGLALSDAGGTLATPYDVLQVGSASLAMPLILRVIEEEGVERIVMGLPLNMDGTHGPMAARAVEFGSALGSASGRKLIFVDERLSSFQAEQDLSARRRGGEKITRKGKKSRLDALAAAGFLQAFLDGKLAAIDV